ncbi:vitamin K epoxide reductase family protein [Chitinophaga eiseniae]|uniref:Thioredoxin domain-containing protein n=1 Tax=Chitinophaga eiseniae TaxID=634771 RepID=A0A847SPY3_9BACT|nr:vitamin K epoxide reductase family protein [Chitinophaga eiseniae]NLR82354.1 thioredoxin domain-containing protein [Chitinophaga eiseniae]
MKNTYLSVADELLLLLRTVKISVPAKFIRHKILSHPQAGSALSITDTLDEMGIANAVLEVDKQFITDLPLPFLAYIHSEKDGGMFRMVKDIPQTLRKTPAFLQEWTGQAVLVEENAVVPPAMLEGFHRPAGPRYALWLGIIALLALLSKLVYEQHYFWLTLLLLSFSGLAIGITIIAEKMGLSFPIAKGLCDASNNEGCDHNLRSDVSQLTSWLSIPDVVLIYFATWCVILTAGSVMSAFTGLLPALLLIAAVAIPVTIATVAYQGFFTKQWCRLCLIVTAILWMQLGVLVYGSTASHQPWLSFSTGMASLGFLFTFLAVAAAWLVIKPVLEARHEYESDYLKLLRFRKDPATFLALLTASAKREITPMPYELQLGNADAPIQLMMICAPFCAPCARAHHILHALLENNDAYGLTIRFTYNSHAADEKANQAIEYLLQQAAYLRQSAGSKEAASAGLRQLLHEWYNHMDADKFKQAYPPVALQNTEALLGAHESWWKRYSIRYTPTIHINGWELPDKFNIADLPYYLRNSDIIEKIAIDPHRHTSLFANKQV